MHNCSSRPCSLAAAGLLQDLPRGDFHSVFQHMRRMRAFMVSHCWAETLPSDAAGLNHFVSLCSIEVILPVTSLGSANLL